MNRCIICNTILDNRERTGLCTECIYSTFGSKIAEHANDFAGEDERENSQQKYSLAALISSIKSFLNAPKR